MTINLSSLALEVLEPERHSQRSTTRRHNCRRGHRRHQHMSLLAEPGVNFMLQFQLNYFFGYKLVKN